jgi:hypothetical protein
MGYMLRDVSFAWPCWLFGWLVDFDWMIGSGSVQNTKFPQIVLKPC